MEKILKIFEPQSSKNIVNNFNGIYPPPKGTFYNIMQFDKTINLSTLEPLSKYNKKIIVGDGAFSEVYLLRHVTTKRIYAIKKMDKLQVKKLTNDFQLIYNEIKIQGRIIHPNITRLYNAIENRTAFYLILEYASNGTLFSLIKKNQGVNENIAFYFFIQILNVVDFLHQNLILHRDLKPENILLTDDFKIKLSDFGWSTDISDERQRSTYCGTVEYIAPEILKNEQYGPSIDVWSLGILLFELLHSHSPFVVKGLDSNKIKKNIIKKDCLRFRLGISNECKDLIYKLLEKNCNKRITIKEIYKHPFIQKYINKINKEISPIKINTNKKINENIYIVNEQKYENKSKIFYNKNKISNNIKMKFNSEKKKLKNSKNKSESMRNIKDKKLEINKHFSSIPNEPEIDDLLKSKIINSNKTRSFNNIFNSTKINRLLNRTNIDSIVKTYKLRKFNESEILNNSKTNCSINYHVNYNMNSNVNYYFQTDNFNYFDIKKPYRLIYENYLQVENDCREESGLNGKKTIYKIKTKNKTNQNSKRNIKDLDILLTEGINEEPKINIPNQITCLFGKNPLNITLENIHKEAKTDGKITLKDLKIPSPNNDILQYYQNNNTLDMIKNKIKNKSEKKKNLQEKSWNQKIKINKNGKIGNMDVVKDTTYNQNKYKNKKIINIRISKLNNILKGGNLSNRYNEKSFNFKSNTSDIKKKNVSFIFKKYSNKKKNKLTSRNTKIKNSSILNGNKINKILPINIKKKFIKLDTNFIYNANKNYGLSMNIFPSSKSNSNNKNIRNIIKNISYSKIYNTTISK